MGCSLRHWHRRWLGSEFNGVKFMNCVRPSALLLALSLVSCNTTQNGSGPPPIGNRTPPSLTWTSMWNPGTHLSPLAFQASGQVATLTASLSGMSNAGFGLTSGSCASLSANTANGPIAMVTVTATSSGTCNIVVTALGASSTMQVTVP